MANTRTFLNATATGRLAAAEVCAVAGLPVVAGVCDPGGAGLRHAPSNSQTGPTRAFTNLQSTGSGVTDPGYNLSGFAANVRH